MEIEEDTYSSIFQALKHPIRRRILRMLNEKPMTYTEILNELGVDNGLLNYHLENLRELLAKGKNEKYRLSEFGKAGLSVIDRVETPKDNNVQPNYKKLDSLPSILIIVLLFISALLNGYYFIDNQNLKRENIQAKIENQYDIVSGIVIHRAGHRIWLRLNSPDNDHNKEVGDIMEYRISDSDFEVDVGDCLQGKLTENMTLVEESIVPFFEYDYNDGFVLSGNLLLFSGGRIDHDLSNPFPRLSFGIKNLGEKEVIAIRARINELELPYTFEVSQDSPLRPSRGETFSCYTAWYTPGGGTGGYVPKDDEEYTVTVTVKFSGYSTRTFTSSSIYKEGTMGSICFLVGRNYVHFGKPDLLRLGHGLGGSLSLSFRNEWNRLNDERGNEIISIDALNSSSRSIQTIEELKLYLEDTLVWEESVRIRPAEYFAVTVPVPRELVPGQTYDVTLVAYSEEGLNSTYTISTLCQYIRIN